MYIHHCRSRRSRIRSLWASRYLRISDFKLLGWCLMVFGSGGGKGTIAKRLEKHYKLPVLGTGDIIRQHIRDGTEVSALSLPLT